MTNNRLTEVKNYRSSGVEFGDEIRHVSKSDVEYGKIPIEYGGGQFLLRVSKCKTMGVQSMEMDGGYTRRTMPLVFDDEQAEFAAVFSDIVRNAYEQLVLRGYSANKLSKLGSSFWRDKILYAGIVDSVYDSRSNTRYFMGEEEVGRNTVGEGIEYDATAAVLIDSIYVGSKTVSIQVKLYEVSLSRARGVGFCKYL